jgi:hypothetical protein
MNIVSFTAFWTIGSIESLTWGNVGLRVHPLNVTERAELQLGAEAVLENTL